MKVLIYLTLFMACLVTKVSQATTKASFFSSRKMYTVEIKGWPVKSSQLRQKLRDQKEWAEHEHARVRIYAINPKSNYYCPDKDPTAKLIYEGRSSFRLRTSGNLTNGTPKSSYKLKLKEKFLGMKTINLKSMWNDPSMMREAVAWKLFALGNIPAPGQTYAKFCVNNQYFGLYSIIEQVDKAFLKDRFGADAKGNLYKAYWGSKDIGPATLAYRQSRDGDDSGKQYFRHSDNDERTYRLKTNKKSNMNNYNDLAQLIKAARGKDAQNDYVSKIESKLDVLAFLRWAAINQLLGAWDNYFRTGANYYLYNKSNDPNVAKFVWIPWDYDNSFGISYREDDLGHDWQYWPLDKWELGKQQKYERPLISNLLQVKKFRDYYFRFTKIFMSKYFNVHWITAHINRLFPHIKEAAYKEATCPKKCDPFTGRQFSNHAFYLNAGEQDKIYHGKMKAYGMKYWVQMRSRFVREQLAREGY